MQGVFFEGCCLLLWLLAFPDLLRPFELELADTLLFVQLSSRASDRMRSESACCN